MPEIREIEAADHWDEIVRGFRSADLRQGHAWGEIRRRQGWTPVRLAAFEGGECVAALGALCRRLPLVGAVGYAPRGPLLHDDDLRGFDALPALADAVRARAGVTFLRVSPAVADERHDVRLRLRERGFCALPDFWSLWNSPRNVMRMPLDGSEQDLLRRMARKRRQHISTAARRGITADVRTDVADLGEFYRLLVDHADRNGYPVRDRGHLEALRAAYGPSGDLAVATGRVHGRVVSALLGVRFGALAYPLYAPSAEDARGLPVGDLVHWEWIRWARSAGCRELDFGSSGTHVPPRETDANLGIYRFKVEIGCVLTLWMPYHDMVFDPIRYRLARTLERRALGRLRFWFGLLPSSLRGAVARRAA